MYPHLLELIHWIAAGRELQMKGGDPTCYDDRANWPNDDDLAGGLEFLEWQASRLSHKDKEMITAEGGESVARLLRKHRCYELSDFLHEVSEGEYFSYFFTTPEQSAND